jgi:Phage endonuclease I
MMRSKYEEQIAKTLKTSKIPYQYESLKVKYTIPATLHSYCPDFVLPNGILIEAKGIFNTKDRKKHLLIKEQQSQLDIRFLFQNPNLTLNKKSKTTYWQWCEKNGFEWAKGPEVPSEWVK